MKNLPNLLTKLKDPRTNWKYVLIVTILAFIVGGGILSYHWWIGRKEVKVFKEERKIVPPAEKLETKEMPANLKTYRSERYGYEIEYPSEQENWFLEEKLTNPCLSYSPLEEINLFTIRGFCKEDDSLSCLPDVQDWIIIVVAVYEKPPTTSIEKWLAEGEGLAEECTSPFIKYVRDGIDFYENVKCRKCFSIYITKEESRYPL
jgi:hypothetical protein